MRKLRVDVTPPATMSGVHTIACDVVPGSALFKVLGDSKTTKCPSGAATAADDDDASDASDTDSDSDEDKCQAWLLHYVFTAVDPVYNAEVCSHSTYTPDKVVGPGRLKDVIAAGKGGAAAIEWAAFDEYVPGCDHRADDEEKEEDEGNDVGGDEVLKERRSPRERGRMGTSHHANAVPAEKPSPSSSDGKRSDDSAMAAVVADDDAGGGEDGGERRGRDAAAAAAAAATTKSLRNGVHHANAVVREPVTTAAAAAAAAASSAGNVAVTFAEDAQADAMTETATATAAAAAPTPTPTFLSREECLASSPPPPPSSSGAKLIAVMSARASDGQGVSDTSSDTTHVVSDTTHAALLDGAAPEGPLTPYCGACARLCLVLGEAGVPFETVMIDRDAKPAWFKDAVREGTTPAVRGGFGGLGGEEALKEDASWVAGHDALLAAAAKTYPRVSEMIRRANGDGRGDGARGAASKMTTADATRLGEKLTSALVCGRTLALGGGDGDGDGDDADDGRFEWCLAAAGVAFESRVRSIHWSPYDRVRVVNAVP